MSYKQFTICRHCGNQWMHGSRIGSFYAQCPKCRKITKKTKGEREGANTSETIGDTPTHSL